MPDFPKTGELRWRGLIEKPPDPATTDSIGEVKPAWKAVATRQMKVEGGRGGETVVAEQVNPQTIYRVWLRYDPAIDSSMRVTISALRLVLYIRSVLILGSKQWLELECGVGKP